MTDTFSGAGAPGSELQPSPGPYAPAPPTSAGARKQAMSDALLLRLIEEAIRPLSAVDGHSPCMEMAGSYNAMLNAARTNHPDHPFLAALTPIDSGGFISVAMMVVLLGQLRIVLETLQ